MQETGRDRTGKATEQVVKVRQARQVGYQPKGNRHGEIQTQGSRKEAGKPVQNNRVQMKE